MRCCDLRNARLPQRRDRIMRPRQWVHLGIAAGERARSRTSRCASRWWRKAVTSRRFSTSVPGINPLWSPKWESIDPSSLTPDRIAFYGGPADGPLLAGILGHNLCLDIFGGPSTDELAAGCSTHGEGSVARYRLVADGTRMTASATFPLANLDFLRRIELRDTSVLITETVTNNRPSIGRSAGHNTSRSERHSSRTASRSIAARPRARRCSSPFRPGRLPGAWRGVRLAPRAAHRWRRRRSPAFQQRCCVQRLHRALDGPVARAGILRRLFSRVRAGGRIHLASRGTSRGWGSGRRTEAGHRRHGTSTRSRGDSSLAVSPFPETRRAMIDRGRMFETPTYRWIPARTP